MRKGKEQEREAKIFSVIFVLSILIIAGFLIFSNWKIAKKRQELLLKIQTLKQEIQLLENRNQQLKTGIYETEKESFWEAKIREQGYKKPGETAVVIKTEQQAEETETAPKNIWEKFLAEIKGILE